MNEHEISADALACFTFAGNHFLIACVTAENAAAAVQYWTADALAPFTQSKRNRPKVEALLEELAPYAAGYFRVGSPVEEIQATFARFAAFTGNLYAYSYTAGDWPRTYTPPQQLPGYGPADALRAGIADICLTACCYRLADALRVPDMFETELLTFRNRPPTAAERAKVEAVRKEYRAAAERFAREFPALLLPSSTEASEDFEDKTYTPIKRLFSLSGIEIV